MDLELKYSKKVLFIKETGKTAILMVRVRWFGLKVIDMKENSKTVSEKAKAELCTKVVKPTKESGKKI